MASRPITNDRLYDAINSSRLELKGDLNDLRRQFETLESGRITRLESQVADMQLAQVKNDAQLQENQAVLSTKFVIITGIGIIILTGLSSAFWLKVLHP